MFGKKKTKITPEIPSAALADMAFLLLIFFLVTTTIDVDSGIGLVLPPPPDPNQPEQQSNIKERNMLKILVNSAGLILVDEKPAAITQVKQMVIDFVDNGNRPAAEQNAELSESPQKAIISLKTDRQTPYDIYIQMLDEVKGAYSDLRDRACRIKYGISYTDYLQKQKAADSKEDEFKDLFPQKISEAEPDAGAK
jgi:biopolymer transport protein ExbD